MLCPGTAVLVCAQPERGRGGELLLVWLAEVRAVHLPSQPQSLSHCWLLASGKLKFYSSFPSIRIWLTMPTLLHQNTYFKDLQKGDMSIVTWRELGGSCTERSLIRPWMGAGGGALPCRSGGTGTTDACFMDSNCTYPTVCMPTVMTTAVLTTRGNGTSELRKGTESFFKNLCLRVLKISLWKKCEMLSVMFSHSCLYYFSANIPFLMKNIMGNCFLTNTIYFPSPPAAYNFWENGTGRVYLFCFLLLCLLFLKMRPFQGGRWGN